jgi:hypothetical protein
MRPSGSSGTSGHPSYIPKPTWFTTRHDKKKPSEAHERQEYLLRRPCQLKKWDKWLTADGNGRKPLQATNNGAGHFFEKSMGGNDGSQTVHGTQTRDRRKFLRGR